MTITIFTLYDHYRPAQVLARYLARPMADGHAAAILATDPDAYPCIGEPEVSALDDQPVLIPLAAPVNRTEAGPAGPLFLSVRGRVDNLAYNDADRPVGRFFYGDLVELTAVYDFTRLCWVTNTWEA